MPHQPNPFDFVAFPEQPPTLKTIDEWSSLGELRTGYLELQIKAYTPLHIVGKQEAETGRKRIKGSHFHRRNDRAFIPGSSVRGMLRGFIETACNCWASQMTPYYHRVPKHRSIGFIVNEDKEEEFKKEGKVDKDLKPSLPKAFSVPVESDGRMDLASFLFGYVPEKGDAWHGLVTIEDAPVAEPTWESFQVPDIEGEAIMGGPNPSAKTWWYHKPYAIRKRTVQRDQSAKPMISLDFIGNGFRGRKFYFHQNPKFCVNLYTDRDWRGLYYFPLECLAPGKNSESFRLYFERLPVKLLSLIVWSLSPHKTMKHKLGYGKPFGYGSVSFELKDCRFRKDTRVEGSVAPDSASLGIDGNPWDMKKIKDLGVSEWIHLESLKGLYRILYYDDQLRLSFIYPKFSRDGFLGMVSINHLTTALNEARIHKHFNDNLLILTPTESERIAESLYRSGIKPALDFQVYQKTVSAIRTLYRGILHN